MLTPSFARALRKTALTRFSGMVQRYDAALEDLVLAAYRGKWTAKRANAFWKEAAKVSRHCFGGFFFANNAFHFAPRIDGERLRVQTVRIEVPARHRPNVYDATVPVELGPHAVERLFLRLDTVEADAVQREIMHGMLIAFAANEAARKLGLKQMPLPTANGAFLCEVIEGRPLFARTWLRRSDPARGTQSTAPKWERVIQEMLVAVHQWVSDDGKTTDRKRLRAAAIGLLPEVQELADALTGALEGFWWLRNPYEAGPDLRGEVWTKARAQAEAQRAA